MEPEWHVVVSQSTVIGGEQPLTLAELPDDVGRELRRRGLVAIDVASDGDWLVVLCLGGGEPPFAGVFLFTSGWWQFRGELLVGDDIEIGRNVEGQRRLHVSWHDWEGDGNWELGVQELLHLPPPGAATRPHS